MTNVRPLPVSGYRIEKVYSSQQKLCTKQDDASLDRAIHFSWDWQPMDDEVFEVKLSVSIEPAKGREEFVEANIIGRFRQAIPEPTVSREDFVRLQAAAILMPYVREVISSLTSHGFYGTYYLPSLNIVRLMQDFDPALATGAQQQKLQATSSAAAKAIGPGEAVIAPLPARKKGRPKKTAAKAKRVST